MAAVTQARYAENDALLPFLSIIPADVASSGMVATGATADVYRGTYSQSTDVALRLAGSPDRSETKQARHLTCDNFSDCTTVVY